MQIVRWCALFGIAIQSASAKVNNVSPSHQISWPWQYNGSTESDASKFNVRIRCIKINVILTFSVYIHKVHEQYSESKFLEKPSVLSLLVPVQEEENTIIF